MVNSEIRIFKAEIKYLWKKEIILLAVLSIFLFIFSLYNLYVLKLHDSLKIVTTTLNNRYVFIIFILGLFLAGIYAYLFKIKKDRKEFFIRISKKLYIRYTYFYIIVKALIYGAFIVFALYIISAIETGNFDLSGNSIINLLEVFLLATAILIFLGLAIFVSEIFNHGLIIKIILFVIMFLNLVFNMYNIPVLNLLNLGFYLSDNYMFNIFQLIIKLVDVICLTVIIKFGENGNVCCKSN